MEPKHCPVCNTILSEMNIPYCEGSLYCDYLADRHGKDHFYVDTDGNRYLRATDTKEIWTNEEADLVAAMWILR